MTPGRGNEPVRYRSCHYCSTGEIDTCWVRKPIGINSSHAGVCVCVFKCQNGYCFSLKLFSYLLLYRAKNTKGNPTMTIWLFRWKRAVLGRIWFKWDRFWKTKQCWLQEHINGGLNWWWSIFQNNFYITNPHLFLQQLSLKCKLVNSFFASYLCKCVVLFLGYHAYWKKQKKG